MAHTPAKPKAQPTDRKERINKPLRGYAWEEINESLHIRREIPAAKSPNVWITCGYGAAAE
jgi:hypothetical protein